ncbi:hypothetical protein [Roseburia sp. AF20-18LB]|uniref:hypothetical protein n=1 Tax=Roseburia sp. AF20-18LB TaxID=2293129 RepID=UPI0011C18ACE|nr:hypothetical protein [Roseburia sp. AF20-18LB]
MMPTILNSKKIQSKLFYILTFCIAVVLVSLIMIHPTEVKAEDLSVGYPVNGTQKTDMLGSTTKNTSDVSVFKVTHFSIHYKTIKGAGGLDSMVHNHTLTYKFRSLGGNYDTAPIYAFKTAYPSGYYGVYKKVYVYSEQPFEIICTDADSDGHIIYNRTSTYSSKGSLGYGCAVLDFPGNAPNEYFLNSGSWWDVLGFVYDHLGGTALETKDHNIRGNEIEGVVESGTKTDLGFSSDNATHTDKLGSLMGMTSDVLTVTGGNNQTIDCAYVLKWKGKTSTGFDLTDTSVYKKIEVQTRVQCKGYYYSGMGSTGDLVEMVHNIGGWFDYKNVTASDKKVRVAQSEINTGLPSFFDEYKDISNLHMKYFDVYFYLRPVALSDDGWLYGDWVQFKYDKVSGLGYITGDADGEVTGGDFDPDSGEWKPNPDSPSNGNEPIGTGNGSSLDDAEDDAISNGGGGGSSGGLTDLKSFFEMVGQIPALISDVLSFLPAWCLGFIAFGFAVFVALMIVKAVRG